MPWQVIPIWTTVEELDANLGNYLNTTHYNVSTAIEIKAVDSLQHDLKKLLESGQILLFLRSITKISVAHKGITSYTIEKKFISQQSVFNEVSLRKNGLDISNWIVKTFENISVPKSTKSELKQDEKTPNKLKSADFTEISLAARIEDGKIKALKGEESIIFTYLPTKVIEFEFPFLINGSFLTNAAREGLHEDRVWNQWLLRLVAEKLVDWLASFVSVKYKYQILHLLPNKFNSQHNALKRAFNESLSEANKNKRFIPSKSSTLKKASKLIVDNTGLSELDFVSSRVVVDYINSTESTSFSGDCFVHPTLQKKSKLLSLGSTFFDTDNLDAFFISQQFTTSHQVSDNFSLIQYFYKKARHDKSKEWHEKLKEIPFIVSEGKCLKSPRTVCFPSIAFKTEFGDEVSVIHDQVYRRIENSRTIKNWLEKLGVKEPSDTAYLENEIIGNIEECINANNYLKITRYLFNQHKKGHLSEEHYRELQDLRVFTTCKEFISAKLCYLSDCYEPLLSLEKVHKSGKYVTDTYKQSDDLSSEWKTFFLKIGVSENISIIRIAANISTVNSTIENSYFHEMGEKAEKGHRYPHLVSERNTIHLDKIRFSEFAREHKFSKLLWKQAISTISLQDINQYAFMPWGYFGSQRAVENYFFWSIHNSCIFPTTTKQCLKANDIW